MASFLRRATPAVHTSALAQPRHSDLLLTHEKKLFTGPLPLCYSRYRRHFRFFLSPFLLCWVLVLLASEASVHLCYWIWVSFGGFLIGYFGVAELDAIFILLSSAGPVGCLPAASCARRVVRRVSSFAWDGALPLPHSWKALTLSRLCGSQCNDRMDIRTSDGQWTGGEGG